MTAYQRGDYFEKKCAAALTGDGYVCWQTRGSKTPVDIVALKPTQVLLVQCKGGDKPISGAGWNALFELAYRLQGEAILADRDGTGIRWRRIVGWHADRSQTWPCTPWTPDEAAP
jgi:Holliday junction resolvase